MAGATRTRVGVVGAGFIAEYHLQILRELPGVELTAVVDPDARRARSLAARFGIPGVCASVEEMLASARPDVAHVLVPPDLHASVAEQLLRAGVGVFLEKPLATHREAAAALVRLADEHRVPLGVNHNNVFHPSFVDLKARLAAGRLGRLEHVFVCLHVPLRQLGTGDYRHWMFQEPRNVVLEQGAHPFSQVHALLGEVQDLTVLRGGTRLLGPGLTFHDTWQIEARCERGPATVLLSFGKDFAESWLHAIAQDGSVRADFLRHQVQQWTKTPWPDFHDQWILARRNACRGLSQGFRNVAQYVLSTLRLQGRSDTFYVGMKRSLEAFHRAVQSGQTPPCSGRDGLAVLEFCERATQGVEASPRPPAAPLGTPQDGEILVTGGTGFLGRSLVARLRARGHGVRLLVRRPELLPEDLRGAGISVVRGELSDAGSLREAARGVRAVYHLATGGGETWEEVQQNMVGGCRRLAEESLAQPGTRFYFTSTIAVFYLGNAGDPPVKDLSVPDPRPEGRPLYARGKIACEQVLQELREKGLAVTVFRPGVVLGADGPLQHSGVGLWTRDTQCFGWGTGKHSLPLVLVEDVAHAMVAALEREDTAGHAYNLVGDVRLTAREYVETLRTRLERDFQFHGQWLWWMQGVEIFKWLVKKATRRPHVVFPSFRDLKTRSLARPFDNSGPKQELGWSPESDRATFLERVLGTRVAAAGAAGAAGEGAAAPGRSAAARERESPVS